MHYKVFLLVLFALFTGAMAQHTITLQSALDMAGKNNPEINQMRLDLRAAQKAKYLTFGIANPQLIYMKEGIDRNSGQGFDEERLGVSQSINFPLTSFFRFREAQFEIATFQNLLRNKELELRSSIKDRYAVILYNQKIVGLREQQLQVAQELHNAAQTRLEVGESSQLDLMKAEIEVANAVNDLESAKQTEHTSHYALFNLIGLHPEEQVYGIQFTDSLVYEPHTIFQRDVLDRLEAMPVYQGSIAQVRASGEALKSAYSTVLPDISFDVYQQNFGEGNDNYGFEVGLDIPIWFLFNELPDVQIAHVNKQTKLWQQKQMRLELKREIEFAWHGYYESKTNIERFAETIRPKSLELRDLTLIGYQDGEIDLIEFLDAQRTYLSTEHNYLEALLTYYLQIIKLEKYLDQEYVLKVNKVNE